MKPRSKTVVGLTGCCLIFVILCVQLSNGFSLREKREAKTNNKNKKVTVIKKQGIAQDSDKGLDLNGKVKISELKPCISKAFCEVNAITDGPTFEANKEFYTILNRLSKLTGEDDIEVNGSGSVEESEEEPSSEESSYERIPQRPPPNRSSYPPRYPGYRRGKSLDGESDKIKKKNKKKLNKELTTKTIVNGTEVLLVEDSTPKNRTSRQYTAEQKEKQAFVARKTSELNVVDDLAALIKISAEIGQALRSPRRCRTLFKKCQMNYDQIIEIFNQTQTVVTDSPPKAKTESADTTTAKPKKKSTTSRTPTSKTTPASTVDPEKQTTTEGNRAKKSRHEFSDEENDDIEYITDTELQPVRTYALFTPAEQQETRHPEEILVEEAFKKYDNTFPVSGAPENLDFLKKRPSKSKNMPMQPPPRPPSSSEEDEGSNESSGSQESPGFRIEPPYNGYQHRSSEDTGSVGSGEFRKAKNKKFGKDDNADTAEDTELTGQADFEDDAEAPVEQSIKKSKKNKKPVQQAQESSEEEEGSDEVQTVYTRDEEQPPKGHKHVRPHLASEDDFPQEEEHNLKVQSKRKKQSSRENKRRRPRPPVDEPEDDQNSSEEEIQRDEEKEMPPPGSPFYNLLSGMNNGQGADGIPGKPPKKGKRPSGHGGGQGGPQGGYGGGQPGGYGGGQQGGYGDYGGGPGGPGGYGEQGGQGGPGVYPGGGADSSQPSFFQSIMSWFSRSGAKPTSQEQPYGDQPSASSYGGGSPSEYGGKKPYGQELPTYDDYKQSGRPSKYPPPPQGYNSRPPYSEEGFDGEQQPPSHNRRPGGRRPPKARDDESSEEADEDETPKAKQTKKSQNKGRSKPQNKSIKNGNKSSSKQHPRAGPPPPVVIVPEVEEGYAPNEDFQTVVKSNIGSQNGNKDTQRSKGSPSKPSKPPADVSDEESRETSSEEVERSPPPKKNSPSNTKKSQGNPNGPNRPIVPSYEKYYTKIFGSAEDIDAKLKKNQKSSKEERENSSILLTEFDKISNSFSTSADKIPDWSEEDNPKKKINVGSLASNTKKAKGKYTVNKNKRNNKPPSRITPGSQYSYEGNAPEDKGSSEEEDKK